MLPGDSSVPLDRIHNSLNLLRQNLCVPFRGRDQVAVVSASAEGAETEAVVSAASPLTSSLFMLLAQEERKSTAAKRRVRVRFISVIPFVQKDLKLLYHGRRVVSIPLEAGCVKREKMNERMLP